MEQKCYPKLPLCSADMLLAIRHPPLNLSLEDHQIFGSYWAFDLRLIPLMVELLKGDGIIRALTSSLASLAEWATRK